MIGNKFLSVAGASTPVDAQFNYVTMLLHADGTNGATNGGSSTSNTPPFNTDASTNAFPIVNNGDTKPNNFNPYQDGYYANFFDGTQTLAFPSNTAFAFGTGAYTVEMWVFATGIGSNGYSHFFNAGNATGSFGFAAGSDYSLNIFGYGTGAVITGSANDITKNAWNHIAVCRSSTSSNDTKIYVNGVLKTTGTDATNWTVTTTPAVGGITNLSGYSTLGYISNCRVVKGTAVYTSAFTPSTTPLTAISGTSLLTCQSNRFIDTSTNAFTITPNGSPSVTYKQPFTLPSTFSTYGSGYFDGTGDYLKAANNTALQIGSSDFTIECWYYSTVAAGDVLWSKAANGSAYTGYYMNVQGGGRTPVFYATATGSSWAVALASSITLKLNSWNHIAVTRSGSTWTVWVNGVSGGTATSSATILDDGSAFTIGALADATSLITGYVSDLRFVKGTAVYTATFTPPTTPLTAISGTSLLTVQTNGAANDSGFLDSSPNNFLITRNGNTTQGSFSPYGPTWSNYFNGSSYLTVPAIELRSMACTIEFWFYGTANGTQVLVNNWDTGSSAGTSSWTFNYDGTNVVIYSVRPGVSTWDAGSGFAFSAAAAKNTWHHVALTSDGSTSKFFVNGALIGTGSYPLGGANSTNFTFGINTYFGNGYFTGYLSNVRMIAGTQVYTSAFTPPTAPLTPVTNTKLLTCQGNRFYDANTQVTPKVISAYGTPSVQRFNPFGTSTAYSTATIGGSGYFDGSGDYLTTDNLVTVGTSDFTYEAWVYITATSYELFYQPVINGPYITFNASGSTWAIGQALGSVNNNFGAAPTQNQWHYIAVSRSGTTVNAYIDGVRVYTGSNSVNYAGGTGLRFGMGISGPYTGYASDLRISFNYARYTGSTMTVPTAPVSSDSNTYLLLNFTNAGIYDNAMMNDLETVGNAQISTSVKKYGTGSLYFDGTGDWLQTATKPDLDLGSANFTIEAWIYPQAEGGKYFINVNGTTGGYGQVAMAVYGTAKIEVDISASSNTWTIVYSSPNNSITLNAWNHVALVRSGSAFTLYLNGVGYSVGTTSSALYSYGGSTYIGSNGNSSYVFNGYIDDLRITKGYARYTTTFTPPTAALPNIGPT